MIPKFLEEKLSKEYSENILKNILDGYKAERKSTIRVNTIKSNLDTVKKELVANDISFNNVNWYKDALIINNVREDKIKELSIYKNGEIYLQSLSSMLPPICLSPKEKDNVLDMAAAPGGKTTQIAAMCNNKVMITACEKNKIRSERLKYNLNKQGVKCVNVMVEDARMLSDYFSFDKILLDAPCSGSGTNGIFNSSFTEELIAKSTKIQKALLDKALNILKPGHEMIYSTCSILKEENENILKYFEKKVEIIPIEIQFDNSVKLLPVNIPGTLCISPNELYEGFFVAKLKKVQ